MMAIEIEKKFLVKGDFKPYAYKATQVIQGYISTLTGKTVRVRIMGDKGYLTIKGPVNQSGMSRFEWEKEITVEDVKQLLSLCEPGIIDKVRYLVKAGPYTYEIDEFHGENEGLTVAEIELPDEDAEFERPEWLGEEVTGDRRYYNSMLLKHPYKTWK